jgi:hypothetical protein
MDVTRVIPSTLPYGAINDEAERRVERRYMSYLMM